jgi:hypothetical protein
VPAIPSDDEPGIGPIAVRAATHFPDSATSQRECGLPSRFPVSGNPASHQELIALLASKLTRSTPRSAMQNSLAILDSVAVRSRRVSLDADHGEAQAMV